MFLKKICISNLFAFGQEVRHILKQTRPSPLGDPVISPQKARAGISTWYHGTDASQIEYDPSTEELQFTGISANLFVSHTPHQAYNYAWGKQDAVILTVEIEDDDNKLEKCEAYGTYYVPGHFVKGYVKITGAYQPHFP